MVKRILQKFRRDMHKLVILAILDSILYDSYAIYITNNCPISYIYFKQQKKITNKMSSNKIDYYTLLELPRSATT